MTKPLVHDFSQEEQAELAAHFEFEQCAKDRGVRWTPILRRHWPVYRRAVRNGLMKWDRASEPWGRNFRQATLTAAGMAFCTEHQNLLNTALEAAMRDDLGDDGSESDL